MSAIYLPDGNDALKKPTPQHSVIVVQTADGKEMAFPQVAVAMLSPDVINILAEAVAQRLQAGNLVNEKGQFVSGDTPQESETK